MRLNNIKGEEKMAKKKGKENISCMPVIRPEVKERNDAYVAYKKAKAKRKNVEKSGCEELIQECIRNENIFLDNFLRCDAALPEKERIWKYGLKTD